ncbi:PAS domain-containing protein [Cecembia sp.]|uniref:PAS domain-containing protein n=2 Tax=Cecembia sp. TaxID=1898110 RepID=UPI0025C48A35|nr:PAS domain-containing protein [Cecembia sp.]
MNSESLLNLHTEESLDSSTYLYSVLLNQDNIILNANRKFSQELFFGSNKLEGSHLSDYIFPQDFSKYELLLKKSLSKRERSFFMDLRKVSMDGVDFEWTRWEFFPRYDKNKIKEIVAIGHTIESTSIGKRKKEELFLKQNEFIEKMTFDHSHDMRARVANIIGILEIMGEDKNFEGSQNLVRMLKSEAQKLDNTLKKSISHFVNLDLFIDEK